MSKKKNKKDNKVKFYEIGSDAIECTSLQGHAFIYNTFDFETRNGIVLSRNIRKCINCGKYFLDIDKFNELKKICKKYNFINNNDLKENSKVSKIVDENKSLISKVKSINIYIVDNVRNHGCDRNNLVVKTAHIKDFDFQLCYCNICKRFYADVKEYDFHNYKLFPNHFKLLPLKKVIKEEKRKKKEEAVDEYIKHNFEKFIAKEIDYKSRVRDDKVNLNDKEFFKILNKIKKDNKHDFIIKGVTSYCTGNKHKVVDIEASLDLIESNGKIRKIKCPAYYCNDCKVFYISNFSYDNIRKIGLPLCKLYDMYKFRKDNTYFDLNSESILHLFGYNVAYNNKLSMFQRQTILKNIIDSGIMTKYKVLDFLTYLYSRGKNQPGFKNAISKWKDDIEYVENYNTNNRVEVEVLSITKINYKLKD